MKSFEELVEIARDHSYPPRMTVNSSYFKELVGYGCEIERKGIDVHVYLHSLEGPRKERIESFIEKYGGHSGDSLEKLFEECKLDDYERNSVGTLMKQMNDYNALSHAIMDMTPECQRKIQSARKETAKKYLEENRSHLPKEKYEEFKKILKDS